MRLDLYAGEAHALVGENGAGKSTLVKLLAGVHTPDAGSITVDGAPVRFGGPADARAAGIAVIYQEPTLFPDLSVAENIFVGRQPLRGRGRRIDTAAMRARARELFGQLGVHLDPDRPARGLSIADQQLVEIAKALSFDARVLVMDEPTAALSGVEVDRLFGVARSLRDAGTAVLFISHRFDEVFALCQRITVMRDGAWVSTDPIADVTVDQVVRRMVGREVSSLYPHQDRTAGEVLLEVEGLTSHGVFSDVSFRVRAGEIVALAGLVGAGRSEVIRAVFGVDRYDRGSVTVAGTRLRPNRPAAAIAAGMALVPEDRRQQGLVMELSVERNATLARRWTLSRLGLLWPGGRAERRPDVDATAVRQGERPRRPGLHPVRREPAEGRAGQVARHRPAGAAGRRADPRHRRRHQGRGAPPAGRPRRRRGWRCSWSPASCRRCSAWPTGSSSCTRGAWSPRSGATMPPRSR